MNHHHLVLQHLIQLLAQLYCHHRFTIGQFTKPFFSHVLIPAIAARWRIDYNDAPGEECFYHTFRYGTCGSAMKEKLAILYFAITDKRCAALMPGVFLAHLKRKSLPHTPYWNRYVEEYYKKQKPRPPKLVDWRDLQFTLETYKMKDLKKVNELTGRLMKEKGRKTKLT